MELHHLTPSGILHITTFVTLCEAYMGIDPHFIMWNYFLDAEAAVLEGVVIHVKSKHDVDPYFDLPMSESTDGWQKIWFFFRNNAITPLPVFMGNRRVPQPNWGYGVVRKDLRKLQPLHKVVQQLQQEGLTVVHLLWTFFSCRVQSLHQRVTTMWLYLGPSYPDRPFSEELDDVESNT
jgi:hypothetical protein